MAQHLELGRRGEALAKTFLEEAGYEILDENWRLKKGLTSGISNSAIDRWYDDAKAAGALGGKLLGAGAGGFLMFYAPEHQHEAIAHALRLRRVHLNFESLGSRILFYHPGET